MKGYEARMLAQAAEKNPAAASPRQTSYLMRGEVS